MKQWKWDWQHIVILAAFAVGLVWAFGTQVAGKPLDAATVLPALMVVASGLWGFFKNPPSTPEQALAEGESATGGSAAAKRGFVQLRLVGALAIVGILAVLVIAPRATVGVGATASGQGCAFWKQESPKVVQDLSGDGMCVLQAVLGGTSDPALIASKCAPLTVAQVAQVVSDLASYYLNQALSSSDAGTAGAAPPDYKGVPASLGESDLARLVATRDYMAAGASK